MSSGTGRPHASTGILAMPPELPQGVPAPLLRRAWGLETRIVDFPPAGAGYELRQCRTNRRIPKFLKL
jgi:hypothetical protein